MTWPLHSKPPRIWVRPLGNLGFEVMCSSDFIGERRIGYRHKFGDANALAQKEHTKALDLIASVEESLGKPVDVLMPVLELWEAADGTA